VPAVPNVVVNFAPGAIAPEFHAPPVDVCAVLSLLVHVTLPPTAIVTGLGAKAVVVMTEAPETIETGVPFPPVFGVGVVIGVEYDDPQPAQTTSSAAARVKRK
jgi:hypothetical protein